MQACEFVLCKDVFAGRKNPGGLTPRGAKLIATLNERYGPTGRVLWHDMDIIGPAMMADVARVVLEAETEINAQLAAGTV